MANTTTACTIETHAASDGYCWRYRHYPAGQSPPRARVVCIHGIQSHGGWYEHSCTRLSQSGYDVVFLDRRGSGMNEQQRGDAPSFRRLLDDLAEFLTVSRADPSALARGSRLNNFLVAISWGGKLAAALQKRHPGLVDGLALLCPGFFPRVGLSLKEKLKIAWARLRRPEQLFPIPLNDPELFTASPQWQQFIRDDALGLRQATARLMIESVRLDGYLKVVPKHVKVPVLLMLAGRDRIIDNDKTRRYFERFASTDKEVLEYPEAHHTLEFEPEPDRFIGDLQNWVERHIITS